MNHSNKAPYTTLDNVELARCLTHIIKDRPDLAASSLLEGVKSKPEHLMVRMLALGAMSMHLYGRRDLLPQLMAHLAQENNIDITHLRESPLVDPVEIR
jgi:hypothetical protein